MSAKYAIWEQELTGDPDRDFILRGLKEGFMIVDSMDIVNSQSIVTKNNNSATHPKVRDAVEQQLKSEIAHGHYVIVDKPPTIISALSAVPK